MKTNTKNTRILQIELSKKFGTRDEKLDFLSHFFGHDVKTSKDLTQYQTMDAIRFLKTDKKPDNANWAYFDKSNPQHMNILSKCITYGWSELKNGVVVADLNRLGRWLKSFRSPVQKPILEMEPSELSIIINALNGMIEGRYK